MNYILFFGLCGCARLLRMLNTLMSLERIIVYNSAKVGEDQNMEGFDSSLNKNYKFYSVGFSGTH